MSTTAPARIGDERPPPGEWRSRACWTAPSARAAVDGCRSMRARLRRRRFRGCGAGAEGGVRARDPGAGRGDVIRVLIAEDQGMVRGALASLLGVGARHRGRGPGVPRRRGRRPPRETPGPTSPCSISRCQAPPGSRRPSSCAASCPACRVLILTTFGRPGYLRRAMESGASGFLLKDAPADELALGDPARGRRRARRRSRPGCGGAQPGREPADPARARGAGGLAAARHGRGVGRRALPVPGHGPQPSLVGDAEARRAQPGRGRAGGGGARLAVTATVIAWDR